MSDTTSLPLTLLAPGTGVVSMYVQVHKYGGDCVFSHCQNKKTALCSLEGAPNATPSLNPFLSPVLRVLCVWSGVGGWCCVVAWELGSNRK